MFELKKHTCIVTSEEFEFPVLQIEVLEEVDGKESRILAIDSAGNIKTLSFFYKSFVIKTFISCKDVSLVLRNKKR